MLAKLIRLHTPADRLHQDDVQQLRQRILAFGNCPARANREILHVIDLATASGAGRQGKLRAVIFGSSDRCATTASSC